MGTGMSGDEVRKMIAELEKEFDEDKIREGFSAEQVIAFRLGMVILMSILMEADRQGLVMLPVEKTLTLTENMALAGTPQEIGEAMIEIYISQLVEIESKSSVDD